VPVSSRGGGVTVGAAGGEDGGGGGSSLASKMEDCGSCAACRDKVKFGGRGVRKARCELKPKGNDRRRSAPSATAATDADSATDLAAQPVKGAPPVKKARGRPPRPPDPKTEPEGGRIEPHELNSIDKVLDVRTRALSDVQTRALSKGGSVAPPHSLLRAASRAAAGEAGVGSGVAAPAPLVTEYLCKMRGLAHVHARWMSQVKGEPQLTTSAQKPHYVSLVSSNPSLSPSQLSTLVFTVDEPAEGQVPSHKFSPKATTY
jgi:hypothetical protein